MNILKRFAMCICLATSMTIASCQQSTDKSWTSLSYEDFSAAMDEEAGQIVDVRTSNEFVTGHIPGAVNIDIKDSQFAEICEEKLVKGTPVYVYCRSGRRSKIAAGILADKGYKVLELNTGIEGWKGKKEYGVH